MSVKVGDIVVSKRGHDAKQYFIVIAVLNESYVLIGDGVKRKLDNLKQKNVKHLKVAESADGSLEYIVDDKSIATKLKHTQTQN